MTKLIINADDFGYSSSINYGIIEAHQNGILTSTTMMANMSGFNNAIQLAKENPKLGIGVHLSLSCGKPIVKNLKTLVDENGNFHSRNKLDNNEVKIDLDELYIEWKAQIEKIKKAGIKPTHLDSHHHIHLYNNYYKVFIKLAVEYNLPVRNCEDFIFKKENIQNKILENKLVTTQGFGDITQDKRYRFENLNENKFRKDIENIIEDFIKDIKKYDSFEMMCHPGFVGSEIYFGSSFSLGRILEVSILTNEKIKEIFKDNIILCRFDDLNIKI